MRTISNYSKFLNKKALLASVLVLLYYAPSFAQCGGFDQAAVDEFSYYSQQDFCALVEENQRIQADRALKLKFLTALRTIYQGHVLANELYVRDRIHCLDSGDEGHQYRLDNFEICEEFLRGRYSGETNDYEYGVDRIIEAYNEMRLYAALSGPRRRTDQYYVLKRPEYRSYRFHNRVRHKFSHFLVDFDDVPEPPELPHLSPEEKCEADRRFLTKLYQKEQEFYDRRELGIQVGFVENECITEGHRRDIGLNFTEILQLPHIEEQIHNEFRQPLYDELDAWAQAIFDAQSEGRDVRIDYFLSEEDQNHWDTRNREIEAEFQRRLEHEKEMFTRWDNYGLDNFMHSSREGIWKSFKEDYFLKLNQFPVIGLMSLPQEGPTEEDLAYQEQSGYPFTHFYPQLKEAFELYLFMSEKTREAFGEMNTLDSYDDLLPLMANANLVDQSWEDIVAENGELEGITQTHIDELKADLESTEFWQVMREAGVAVALGVSCVSMVLPIGKIKWVAKFMLGRLLTTRWAAILSCGLVTGLGINLEFVSLANNRYLQEYQRFFSSSGVGPEDGIFVMMAIERLDQRSKDLIMEYIMAPVGTGVIAMRGALGPTIRLIRNPRTRSRVFEILERYARIKSLRR